MRSSCDGRRSSGRSPRSRHRSGAFRASACSSDSRIRMPGAFGRDHAFPVPVKGPAPVRCDRRELVEARELDARDPVSRPGDHDVGPVQPDQVAGIADCIIARSTRSGDHEQRAPAAEAWPAMAVGAVCGGIWRKSSPGHRSPLHQPVVDGLDRLRRAHGRAVRDPDAGAGEVVPGEVRVPDSELGCSATPSGLRGSSEAGGRRE